MKGYCGSRETRGCDLSWYSSGNVQYCIQIRNCRCGRVLGQSFSGDFLKTALRNADERTPYRGPEYFADGEYIYKSKTVGDFSWFQGYEEIYCRDEKVYECYYHGGLLK